MFLHLNETVKIQLTDRGRSILKQGLITIEEDADGYSSWTLWMLMYTFGNFLTPEQERPFHSKIKVSDISENGV
jgi:hypothetical protein